MSTRINEIYATENVNNSSKTTKKASNVEVFSSKTPNTTQNPTDWDIAHYETIKKWGAKPYKWTSIVDTNDAIEKSQQSLIDMMRYYEGNPKNNYKAKELKFKDFEGKGTTTYGYGITQLPRNLGKLKTPKNEKEAYNVLMLYLDKVSYTETKNMFKQEWKNFPQSLKEALIDFDFNKGTPILNKKKNAIINAYKTNDWATLLKNLVYVYPGASKADKVEDAGLHKRSLSRAILAVRDVKRTPEIDKAIEKIYLDARKCALAQGDDTVEFDKIYNAYINNGKIVETPVKASTTTKFYNITDKVSVYAIALSLRPVGQNSDCLKAIINEIIKLNEIETDGFDNNGFPKCRSIENEALELPKSILYNGKTLYLNTPTKYKETTEPITEVVVDSVAKPKEEEIKNDTVAKPKKEETPKAETKEEKSVGFFEFLKLMLQLSFLKLKMAFSGISEIKKETPYTEEFDPSLTPFERLLNSKNTTIEQDGEFQIITTKYKVKKGDGIWRLAKTYKLDENNLCEINNIENKNKIQQDQILNIQKLGYKVKEKDNLYQISKKFGIDIETLKDLNNLEDENVIEKGQILELPGYIHTVKKGENLTTIAQKVKMPLQTLIKINGLTSDKIKPGDKIKVVYNEANYAITNRTVTVNKETNETVEVVKFDKSKGLSARPLLQKATKVNGKYVATRAVFEPTGKGSLDNKTIIVNAGHGYTSSGYVDSGTPGLKGLDDEYLLNYDNAMRLKDELCAKGAKVIFLQGKRNLIYKELSKKNNKANLFISVHVNSGGKAPKDRTEIFIRTEDFKANNQSARFAQIAESNFDEWILKNEKISENDKFISPSSKKQDYAQVKHESRRIQKKHYRLGLLDKVKTTQNIPSIIWEVAYMNSPKGRERLSNDNLMDNYAKVMARSIEETLPKKEK